MTEKEEDRRRTLIELAAKAKPWTPGSHSPCENSVAGSHPENIRCPECKGTCSATVFHLWPYNNLTHKCEHCGYLIMESEWERIA